MFETTAAEVLEDGRKLLEHQESYRLIRSQLRSATEKRAGQLSKSVMNELERRLLQRAQSGWFETFLVAVCLLNCVERCSWLFQTWDCEEHSPRVSRVGQIHALSVHANILFSGPWTAGHHTSINKASALQTCSRPY